MPRETSLPLSRSGYWCDKMVIYFTNSLWTFLDNRFLRYIHKLGYSDCSFNCCSKVYRRFWCRICPLGAITALFSSFTPFKQIALTRLTKNQEKCTRCGVCKRVCPTEATDVYDKKGGDVTESRCILCARCVELCPYEGALELKFAGKTMMKSRDWLEQQKTS